MSASIPSVWPAAGPVFVVETQNEVYFSTRKLEATYKHVQFRYKDRVRYRELQAEYCDPPKSKRLINLRSEPLVEVR